MRPSKPNRARLVGCWSLRVLETMRSENGKQVAVAGVWHVHLTTGEVRFRIIEKASREGTRPVDHVGQAGAGSTGSTRQTIWTGLKCFVDSSTGWRIAGLEATVFEGQPPVLMDFEDTTADP